MRNSWCYVKSKARGLLTAFFVVAAAALSAADFAVVANKGSAESSVSRNDLKAMFLGEMTRWDDGKAVTIAVLNTGAVNASFLQRVLGMTPAQFDTHWKKLVFTGKASAPKSFESAAALQEFVAGKPGAVGFVEVSQASGSVKTLTVK